MGADERTPAGYAFATPERLAEQAAPVDQGDAERLRAMAQKHRASMTENLTEEAGAHADAVARYSDWSKAMRLAPERRQQYIDGHAMAADACRTALAHELSDESDAALFERAAKRAEALTLTHGEVRMLWAMLDRLAKREVVARENIERAALMLDAKLAAHAVATPSRWTACDAGESRREGRCDLRVGGTGSFWWRVTAPNPLLRQGLPYDQITIGRGDDVPTLDAAKAAACAVGGWAL